MRHPEITEIVRRDGRYAYEAYEFMFVLGQARFLERTRAAGLSEADLALALGGNAARLLRLDPPATGAAASVA